MPTIDELGNVREDKEKLYDPYTLESIRGNFARIDNDLAFRGLHWERIAVTGRVRTHIGFPSPFPTDPIIACIALGLKDGEEPTKEQIFILDHYLKQCANAFAAFQSDGILPTEVIRDQIGPLATKEH